MQKNRRIAGLTPFFPEWVDDKEYYDSDGNVVEKYKNRPVATGTVTYYDYGWGSYGNNGQYDHLRGGYVTLNADGTLSAASDPNDDVHDDTGDPEEESETGFSFGVTGSASGGAGIGYVGGGAELDFSTMVFVTNRGIRVHQYLTYGGAYNIAGHCGGVPVQEGCISTYGAFGGASIGPTFSTATGSEQIEGPFQAINAGIGPGSLSVQMSPENVVVTPSISSGRGAGGYGNLTTSTVLLPETPTITVINSIPKLPR